MGVRGLGAASSASSSSSSGHGKRAGKRLGKKSRQLRGSAFQSSCLFDKPRTSEFTFFRRFFPEQHTPERDDRSVDSGSPDVDATKERCDRELKDHDALFFRDSGNTATHNEDGEASIDHENEIGPIHARDPRIDQTFTTTTNEDGAIYKGNHKNLFKRIQHHLQELSSRTSKEAGPLSVETLLKRLDVVDSRERKMDLADETKWRWSIDLPDTDEIHTYWKDDGILQNTSLLDDDDEQDLQKNWNIKESSEQSGNNKIVRNGNSARIEDDEDSQDSEFDALKNWNIKEMTRSAWSSENADFANNQVRNNDDDDDYSKKWSIDQDSPGKIFREVLPSVPSINFENFEQHFENDSINFEQHFENDSINFEQHLENDSVNFENDSQVRDDEVSDEETITNGLLPDPDLSEIQAEADETDPIAEVFESDSVSFKPKAITGFELDDAGSRSEEDSPFQPSRIGVFSRLPEDSEKYEFEPETDPFGLDLQTRNEISHQRLMRFKPEKERFGFQPFELLWNQTGSAWASEPNYENEEHEEQRQEQHIDDFDLETNPPLGLDLQDARTRHRDYNWSSGISI